jgi:ATP-dependent Clp protease adaptor protein ClpS
MSACNACRNVAPAKLGISAQTKHRLSTDLEGARAGLYDILDDVVRGRQEGRVFQGGQAFQNLRASLRKIPEANEPMSTIDVIPGTALRMADDDRKRKGDQGGPGTAVITKTKPQTKRPNLYRVLLLNDDYTPMEFVVHVLERFFNKDAEAAHRIMMHVHQHGIGECGVFTYEVAETKVTQVMDFARKHQHPLQCIMEKK